MKLGIFIPNWIGDAAMATPCLRALRRHYGPTAEMIGIMQPYVADVLAGTPWLDRHIYCHKRSKDPSERVRAATKTLQREKPDTVVLLTNSFRTGFMAWMSGARERVGYVRAARGPLLTHKLYHPRFKRQWLPTPAIDAYLQLAYALGCESESPQLELSTTAADEAAADAVWRKHQLPPGDQVVVLNSGGAYGAAKHWPVEYFAELARRIVTEHRLAVLVNCGPSERQIAERIVELAARPGVVSLANHPISVGLSKACIRRSQMLVTTDSGARYFGIAFGRKVITLFGPTNSDWTRTHYDQESCLQQVLPCGPCGARVCPLGHHECMRSLSVGRVFASVSAQLGTTQTQRAA